LLLMLLLMLLMLLSEGRELSPPLLRDQLLVNLLLSELPEARLNLDDHCENPLVVNDVLILESDQVLER